MSPRPRLVVAATHVTTDPARATFYSRDPSLQFDCFGPRAGARGRLGELRANLRLCFGALRHARAVGAAAVVVDSPRSALLAGVLARLVGRRVPLIIWNFNIGSRYRGWRRWLGRFAFGTARALVVYSRHERRCYAELFGVDPGRIAWKHFSGPYLDDARFVAVAAGDGGTAKVPGTVVVPGYSGRDFPLVAAVAAAAPQLRFVVLAYPHALAGVAMPPNVDVRHGLPEVEFCRVLASAQLCFLPIANTVTANGHIAIVQAMSLRTLLLTNETPGTADYLQDGRTCLVFRERDPAALAARIAGLCAAPQQHAAVVAAAHAFAQRHFAVQRDVEMLHRLLDPAAAMQD